MATRKPLAVVSGSVQELGSGDTIPAANLPAHKSTHATGGSDALSASDIGAAASSHNHAGADINSGTVAYARLPVGTTASTVAAGDDSRLSDARTPTSHTHAESDVTGLVSDLAGKADSGHTHTAAAVYAAPRNGGTVSSATNVDGTAAGDAYYVITGNVTFTPTGTPSGRRMVIKAQASGGSRTPTIDASVLLPSANGPSSRSPGALTTGQTVSWAVEYCPLESAWVLNAMQVYG